jgi:uncharacterized membrane protein YfcA
MSAVHLVLLAVAAFAAGAVNAVAGGGSLISFPALVAVGVPTLSANVTNQVALLPGYLGGSLAYRDELSGQRRRVVALLATTVTGTVIGALLLVVSSEKLFSYLAPVLVLGAVVLLALKPRLSAFAAARAGGQVRDHPGAGLHVANFAASVYGGYFGAGFGIMMLAILAIGLEDTLQRLNALKGLLALVVAFVAAVFFAIFGPVRWEAAAVMAAASFLGGTTGVGIARRIPDETLRRAVIVIGLGVSIWLFTRL